MFQPAMFQWKLPTIFISPPRYPIVQPPPNVPRQLRGGWSAAKHSNCQAYEVRPSKQPELSSSLTTWQRFFIWRIGGWWFLLDIIPRPCWQRDFAGKWIFRGPTKTNLRRCLDVYMLMVARNQQICREKNRIISNEVLQCGRLSFVKKFGDLGDHPS